MVIDVKCIRRRLVFSPPHAVSFSNDDVTANTHRRDAEGTANPKNGMHGAACVCVTCYGVRLCERCALVVTYPFCSGLNDDFTANMHCQDAGCAESSISLYVCCAAAPFMLPGATVHRGTGGDAIRRTTRRVRAVLRVCRTRQSAPDRAPAPDRHRARSRDGGQ